MNNIKILSSEIIGEYDHCTVKKKIFSFDGQAEADYHYVETADRCVVIPVIDESFLLLVRKYRFLSDRYSLEFPGGFLLKDELPQEAACRDCLEETGAVLEDVIKIGEFESLNGLLQSKTSVFLGVGVNFTQEPCSKNFGSDEFFQRRVDEFGEMVKRGEIRDAQTLSAWALAKDYLNR